MDKKTLIILVEDNRMDIELTLDAFREVRLENGVKVYQTGEMALNYILGRGKFADRRTHPLPDLILLDVKLPGISGLEVLKKIKQTPLIRRIPVVILTSSREEKDRAMGYDYGANSYLVKPISFNKFLEVISHLCNYWITLNVNAPFRNRFADTDY
ncbi:MAG: response regulator [Calditrichia bacterium]